jgi:transcriptional regulator with XRE-family HTH domain
MDPTETRRLAKILGEQLWKLKGKLSLTAFAKKCGRPRSTVRDYLNGKSAPRDLEAWTALAECLNTNVPFLQRIEGASASENQKKMGDDLHRDARADVLRQAFDQVQPSKWLRDTLPLLPPGDRILAQAAEDYARLIREHGERAKQDLALARAICTLAARRVLERDGSAVEEATRWHVFPPYVVAHWIRRGRPTGSRRDVPGPLRVDAVSGAIPNYPHLSAGAKASPPTASETVPPREADAKRPRRRRPHAAARSRSPAELEQAAAPPTRASAVKARKPRKPRTSK